MQARKWLIVVAAGALAACQGSRHQARSGSASGTGSGATATGTAAPGASGQSDDARQKAEQRAAQQAPSTVPQEGVGGRDPRPLPTGEGAQTRYGEGTPPEANAQGRVPESRLPSAGGTGAGAPATGPDAGDEVTGRVALVDAAQHEIAIDSGSATTQLKVADSAKITMEGKQASFADIRQGSLVRARLDRSGDVPQVTQLEVLPSERNKK